MSRKTENTEFICEHCGTRVEPVTSGSYRNHCPICLYSKHVDELPGDRLNDCGGLMAPVGVTFHTKKGYQIRHRCLKCGKISVNKAALEGRQPDDLEQIIQLMVAS
ncbi:MAG: RNHCP domain-containing protein [Anaerolineales bacterium]